MDAQQEQMYICERMAVKGCVGKRDAISGDLASSCRPHLKRPGCDRWKPCGIVNDIVKCVPSCTDTTVSSKEDNAMNGIKYNLVEPFTPYDLIQAHLNFYKGNACDEWKSDIAQVLHMFGLFKEIDSDGLSKLLLSGPWSMSPRFLEHLLKWGFVEVVKSSTEIMEVFITFENPDFPELKWTVKCRDHGGHEWFLFSIGKDGTVRRHTGLPADLGWPMDEDGRIMLQDIKEMEER